MLMIGDIIGRAGRKAVSKLLPGIREELSLDLVIANGENAAGGFGITLETARDLNNRGVDVFTSGNHIWDRKDARESFDLFPTLVRPLNYPPGVPGRGYVTVDVKGVRVAVMNFSGRTFMQDIDCPFRAFDAAFDEVSTESDIVIADFHAEATSEKNAFGLYADGRAAVVVGTHTHVQTNDDRILPDGTLYMTDVGMCGALNGVIGMKKEQPLERFMLGIPRKFEVEMGGELVFNALFFTIDTATNKAVKHLKISRIING